MTDSPFDKYVGFVTPEQQAARDRMGRTRPRAYKPPPRLHGATVSTFEARDLFARSFGLTYACTIPVALLLYVASIFTDASVNDAAFQATGWVFYGTAAGHFAFAALVGSIRYAHARRTFLPALLGIVGYLAALAAYGVAVARYEALLHYR